MPAVTAELPSTLSRLTSALLLAAVGVTAAQLTWQVFAPDLRPATSIDIAANIVAPAPSEAQESPFARVAEIPLFGVPGVRTAPEPVAAPETRLRLRLLGLAAGDSPDQGRAIIAEGSGPERLYGIGDPLGGGQARLYQIHADRVILERNGTYETLRLPRADGSTSETSMAAPARAAAPARDSAQAGEPRIRRAEWLQDPERLLQTVRARPVIQAGVLHGLEVRPTRNAREFQQAGLRPGDVITSVNGIPLSGIDDADRLFRDLSGQARVEIVVEREGTALPISIQLVD